MHSVSGVPIVKGVLVDLLRLSCMPHVAAGAYELLRSTAAICGLKLRPSRPLWICVYRVAFESENTEQQCFCVTCLSLLTGILITGNGRLSAPTQCIPCTVSSAHTARYHSAAAQALRHMQHKQAHYHRCCTNKRGVWRHYCTTVSPGDRAQWGRVRT